ncbi:MAG: flagellar hook-associated protein FlgK [Lachnospiraceae bacterium]|nr:flagellar hook-associated protein FlgK [Lachnospiraceae bacterium]
MANSMGSLYIGQAGLKMAQNAINTTANNLSNVNTTGYVRQQVLFTDRDYITTDKSYQKISYQQAGLGVSIGDVVHARDIFLDQSYRRECSRANYYTSYFGAVEEVQNYFQEMEGTQFQESINNFWTSLQTLADDPADSVNQNLVIQKASLFLSRSQSVQESLENYQDTINVQIKNDIKRVNEIGKRIVELNTAIQTVEAAGNETAMTMRDERDNLIDELSKFGKVDFKELPNGIVKVSFENTEFIDEITFHEMGMETDPVNGFVHPLWPFLSEYYDPETKTYSDPAYVYQYREKVLDNGAAKDPPEYVLQFKSTDPEYGADTGELKALVLARGDKKTNYTDLLHKRADATQYANPNTASRLSTDLNHLSSADYQNEIGRSIMENTEAEVDRLVHDLVVSINDLFCPNCTASEAGLDGKVLKDAAGNTLTLGANTVIFNEAKAYVGEDGKLPPNELFVRDGCDRYKEYSYEENGKTHFVYVYNEEDPADTSKQYTAKCIKINDQLKTQPSLLPGIRMSDGKVAYELGNEINKVWDKDLMQLNPYDTEKCTFKQFYNKMINDIAIQGTIYKSTSESYEGAVQSIENNRQQVYGVSSDEELQNLIRYQNAYNASSRFINVISSMMEALINNL